MKCIGVNQWTGVDPATAEMIAELGQWAKHSQKTEKERLSRMPPSEGFLGLASERFLRPKIFGIAPVEGYWRIGDWTLAEIRRIVLDDAQDSGKFLIHLQSLYVVDSARGRGEGKKAIEQIRQIADECGCGVTLFAKSFAFSRNGHLPNALQTFEELRQASLEEEWPVIYLPEWDIDCLRFFYEGCGFRNMCLYDSRVYTRAKEEDLPFESQFVYLPRSLDPAWQRQIEHRLNRDLCEFCNR
jgi:GNAT superfamily N-acetyltransferase